MSEEQMGSRGAQAYEGFKEELRALLNADLKRLTLDLQAVSLLVIKVVEFLSSLRERFALLHSSVFEMRRFDQLEDLAWAVWHVKNQLLRIKASSNNKSLPAPLLSAAREQKQRMLQVVSYYLSDPDSLIEISAIRSGIGHVDLANDLTRLAVLFQSNIEEISQDRRFYKPNDVEESRRIADEIVHELAFKGEEKFWAEEQTRVWTLLLRNYNDVRTTAQWLLRFEDYDHDLLPSLYAATRRKANTSKEQSAVQGSPQVSGGEVSGLQETPEDQSEGNSIS